MRNRIIGYLGKVVPKNTEIDLTVPESDRFGHYSTNVAFGLSRVEKKNPKLVAEDVVQKITKTAPKVTTMTQ